jgi:hypothetical protein
LLEPEVPHFLRPRVYEFHGARAAYPDRMQPGYTFVVSSQRVDRRWTPQLQLIDRRGGAIHEWHIDDRDLLIDVEPSHPAYGKRVDEREIHGARLLSNGDVVFNYDYLATFRIDACGTVLWHRPLVDGTPDQDTLTNGVAGLLHIAARRHRSRG